MSNIRFRMLCIDLSSGFHLFFSISSFHFLFKSISISLRDQYERQIWAKFLLLTAYFIRFSLLPLLVMRWSRLFSLFFLFLFFFFLSSFSSFLSLYIFLRHRLPFRFFTFALISSISANRITICIFRLSNCTNDGCKLYCQHLLQREKKTQTSEKIDNEFCYKLSHVKCCELLPFAVWSWNNSKSVTIWCECG